MPTGFIGLGNLGKAIAGRLIDCGEELVVYNRTAEKAAGLKARCAESVAAVSRECDIVFLCLFDSSAVASVLPDLLTAGSKPGLIVDLTTNHHLRVLEFHQMCRLNGTAYLEAPVLGSVIPASRGELTMLISGEESEYHRIESTLMKVTKAIHFMGKPGSASTMKLVNNLVLGGFMATIGEATVLGEKAGLKRSRILEILATGAGNSGVLNAKREKLVNGDFSPHFSAAAIYKDLVYVQQLAEALECKPQLAGAIREMFHAVVESGERGSDLSVVIKYAG